MNKHVFQLCWSASFSCKEYMCYHFVLCCILQEVAVQNTTLPMTDNHNSKASFYNSYFKKYIFVNLRVEQNLQ